jgi:Glycosyl transferase family 2
MPVFDAAPFLAEAIESILGQTVDDLELIVVDNGCRDGSVEIIERFVRADPRLRVIVNDTNLGPTRAANQGWQAARAEYVARLDSDDVALPDRLQSQIGFLDTHPAVAAVGGAVIEIDADGKRGPTSRFATEDRGIRATLMRRNCIAHPAVLMRRSALQAVGGYRLDHAEDYDLWLRLSERYELANLGRPLILYRRHPEQYSLATIAKQVEAALAAVAAARLRRAGEADPLGDGGEVTGEQLVQLEITPAQVAKRVEAAGIEWAATLAGLGYAEDAARLLTGTASLAAPGAARALRAAVQLRLADGCADVHRPLAAGFHLLDALRLAPGYASGRILNRLRDRIRGRRLTRRS